MVPTFWGMTAEQQCNPGVTRQRYDIFLSQAIWHFVQVSPDGLMHFIGFASNDFSYASKVLPSKLERFPTSIEDIKSL